MRLAGTGFKVRERQQFKNGKLTRKWSLILANFASHTRHPVSYRPSSCRTCRRGVRVMDHDGRPIPPPCSTLPGPPRETQNSCNGTSCKRNLGATTRSSRHSCHYITHDSDRVCFMNGRETRTLLGLALGRSFSIWFTNSLDLCPSAFSLNPDSWWGPAAGYTERARRELSWKM